MLDFLDVFEGGMFLAIENPDVVFGSFPFQPVIDGESEGPDVGVCFQLQFWFIVVSGDEGIVSICSICVQKMLHISIFVWGKNVIFLAIKASE